MHLCVQKTQHGICITEGRSLFEDDCVVSVDEWGDRSPVHLVSIGLCLCGLQAPDGGSDLESLSSALQRRKGLLHLAFVCGNLHLAQ